MFKLNKKKAVPSKTRKILSKTTKFKNHPTKLLCTTKTIESVEMIVNEGTNNNMGYNFINPLTINEKLSHCSFKPNKYEDCNASVHICPNCGQKTKLTSSYNRLIYHLSENIIYKVYYYYCYSCKTGWPSIPVDCLPNISLGIDVIGHIAKYHVLNGQSFSSISEHLQECHGIKRSVNALRDSFYRFEILCQKSQKLFETAIQAYFENKNVKFATFDEAFYKSLYNSKLCLGVIFLPEVQVIAGITVSKEHNQEIIKNELKHFKENIGDLDVIGVDLAPMYNEPIAEVFTAISVQYCVFHFFQILFRNIVNPLATEIKKLLKEEIKVFRTDIKTRFVSLRNQLPGKYHHLLEEIEKRFDFCLRRRYPNYLIIEIEIFINELVQSVNDARNSFDLKNFLNTQEHDFLNGLDTIIVPSKSFIRKLKKNKNLIEFQEVFTLINELKSLFQLSEEEIFNQTFQEIEQKCKESSNLHLREILSYLVKYQTNLTTYLRKGVDKTTSVLEQVNQRMKKSTKNNRGGHYETTMQDFSNIYEFFWNTQPFKSGTESKFAKKSPIARLGESIDNDQTNNLSGEWWSWLKPLAYHEYKEQTKIQKEKRKSESRIFLTNKGLKNNNLSLTYYEKAKNRWKKSETLQSIRNIKNVKPIEIIEEKKVIGDLKGLSTFDTDLYIFLLQFPNGIQRSFIVSHFKLPRSTIYDALVRLQTENLIYRKKQSIQKRGRQPVHFLAVPLPNG